MLACAWPYQRKKCWVRFDFPGRVSLKALNSNQLGNSFGINIGGSQGKPTGCQFGLLHILGFMTFEFHVSERQKALTEASGHEGMPSSQKPVSVSFRVADHTP